MIKLKAFILRLSVPFQKWIQRRGRRETVMTKEQVDKVLRLSMPGDILLSYESQRWTSFFIKGFYDHAVIISSRGSVVEAVGDKWENLVDGTKVNHGGVREMDLEEWLYKKDHVALIRVNHPGGHVAGENALKLIGRGYDYYFSHENELIYCSETPYVCWKPQFPEFLAEFEGDEILPQLYLDYSCHNIAPYLECLVNTRA